MCKYILRIYCTEGLWTAIGENGTIERTNPISLLGVLGTTMCRALNLASTKKGSLIEMRSDKASPFSSTTQIQVDSGGDFGNLVRLSGGSSPFHSSG